MLNLGPARKIAAEDEYLPGKDEIQDVFKLEKAGLVEMADLLRPVAATFRLTEEGR
jgi:hypothetical protein